MDARLPTEVHRREQPEASPALLARFLGLGLLLDLLVNRQWPGLGLALFVAVFAVTVRSAMGKTRERDALLIAGVAFAMFTVLRASAPLTAVNAVLSASLLGLAAARDERSIMRARVEDLVRRATHVMLSALAVPAALLAPAARVAGLASSRVRAAARWLAIVIPVFAIFAALLASADRVFASLVLPGWPSFDVGGVAAHVALTGGGVGLAATMWLASVRAMPSLGPTRAPLPRARFGEWASVLVGLDLLFAVFVAVQFTTLFDGRLTIDVTPGLTYAEYARSGFFQLIVVAGLTALVILGGWDLGERTERQQRVFRALVSAMVVLTAVILASALMRLALYEQTFGFTMNRLAGYAAIAWIGAVLLILLAAIWLGARRRVIALALIAGLAVAATVSIMDAEGFVAARNVARYHATGKIDLEYLGAALGPDAVPAMVAVLPDLPRAERNRLRAMLCVRAAELAAAPSGWRSFNAGRAAARDALAAANISPASCA